MNSYNIEATSCLLISDIHQDINFFLNVINKEKGNYDHIIFMGDFFDSYKSPPEVYGAKETAKFVKRIISGEFGNYTLLAGNHDLPYAECWKDNQSYKKKRFIFTSCSGYTNSKSLEINKVLTWDDWKKFQTFSYFGGYLISHAGFHPTFWNYYVGIESNLNLLWDSSEKAMSEISIIPNNLFECGQVRGGKSGVGGPFWLDWDYEFVDLSFSEKDPISPPQIVGHTTKYNSIRKKGRSYCIDGHQNTYAILNKDGNIRFGTINPSHILME